MSHEQDETAASDPNQYLIAHVREALAQDPPVNTLEVQVKVDGRKVFLVGHATASAKRDAITEVASEGISNTWPSEPTSCY